MQAGLKIMTCTSTQKSQRPNFLLVNKILINPMLHKLEFKGNARVLTQQNKVRNW